MSTGTIRTLLYMAIGATMGLSTATANRCWAAASPSKPKARFTKPPKGAVVLFDGKDGSSWRHVDRKKPFAWKIENGAMTIVPKTGNIRTKKTFGDMRLHIEFKCPLMPNATGQGRGNSGIYMQGLYEIQVLDSYGIAKPQLGDCAALYGYYPPTVNACLPPEKWQSYDITFRMPKYDKDGKLTKQGRITCVHNGIKVIDDKELKGATRAHMKWAATKPGPIMLQDHGNAVSYRNIWFVPAK